MNSAYWALHSGNHVSGHRPPSWAVFSSWLEPSALSAALTESSDIGRRGERKGGRLISRMGPYFGADISTDRVSVLAVALLWRLPSSNPEQDERSIAMSNLLFIVQSASVTHLAATAASIAATNAEGLSP